MMIWETNNLTILDILILFIIWNALAVLLTLISYRNEIMRLLFVIISFFIICIVILFLCIFFNIDFFNVFLDKFIIFSSFLKRTALLRVNSLAWLLSSWYTFYQLSLLLVISSQSCRNSIHIAHLLSRLMYFLATSNMLKKSRFIVWFIAT